MKDRRITIKFGSIDIILTALLCILKLTGIVTISWWWCFCLIWLPLILFIGVVLLLLVCAFIYAVVSIVINSIKTKKTKAYK